MFTLRYAFVACLLSMLWVINGWSEDDKTLELKKIVVTAPKTKTPAEHLPVVPVDTPYGTQYNIVTEEQIREQGSYDLSSTLRDVPGVMFQSKNLLGSQTSHSLYIRGRGASHPSSDIIIQFDGVPRFGALFGQVLGDGIAVSTIGGMEVYKSPQPSQFGSGYALVNILPKYLKNDGQEALFAFRGGSYDTFDESLSAGIKKGPFDVYASQAWQDTDGHRPGSAANQNNYYANTGYRINKEWNVRFLVNSVDSKTYAPMPDTVPTATNGVSWPGAERYDTETFFATFTVNHEYERFNGYLKGYWNDTTFDLLQELNNGVRYGGGTGGLRSRQEVGLYGVRGKETFHLWPGGEILLGADLDVTRLKNTQRTYSELAVPGINGGRAERVWDFPDTRLLSPYLAMKQMFGQPEGFHLTPSAGFRYFDHNEFKNKSAAQGGLLIGYKQTNLTINYSRGVNYPTPVVLMNMVLTTAPVNDPSRYWRNIKPEVVDHYEAGITHTWPDRGSLSATIFRDQGKDRFQAFMFGTVPLQFNDPIGRYEIRGLELTGTASPLKDIEFFAGATWLKAEAKGGNGVESDKMPYTPGFQLQAGAKWTFLNNYRLFVDMQHLRDLYQGTFVRSGTFNTPEITSKDKLNDITLFNARVSYHFDYRSLRLGDSEISLAINNIFNQHYEYAKGYPMPGTTIFGGVSFRFN